MRPVSRIYLWLPLDRDPEPIHGDEPEPSCIQVPSPTNALERLKRPQSFSESWVTKPA